MDLTLFLFNSRQNLRGVISQGIVACVHGERDRTLSAEIVSGHNVRPGEFLGLRCIDGRFRLFAVEYTDDDDDSGTTAITAKDAAADELDGTIISRAEAEKITGAAAAAQIVTAAGFTVGKNEGGSEEAQAKAATVSAWEALTEVETTYNLYAEPYYIFNGTRITGKVVDILAKRPTYRGRFVERGSDASGIAVTRTGRPKPKVYGLGADGLTIADVEWKKSKGDPVDKPKGQKWIGVPDAVERYMGRGQVYELPYVTDAGELIKKCWERAQEAAKPEIAATATISDMEVIAGQSWKAVRLWDLVRVRTRYDEDIEEQIIDIKRNYVRPEQTKIVLGKEKANAARQIKALMNASSAASSTLASHGRGIAGNLTKLEDTNVRLYELDGFTHTEISKVMIQLSAQEAAIVLKASREDLSVVENKTNSALIRLDGAEAQILLKADSKWVKGVEEDVSEAYLLIDAQGRKIELKADKIELKGYVTIGQLEAELARINNIFGGYAQISGIRASSIYGEHMRANSSFNFKGAAVSWKTVDVPTSARISGLTGYYVTLGDGSKSMIYAFSTSSPSVTLNKTEIKYMGA